MSLFGGYAFSEDAFSSASVNVTVEVSGDSVTTAFNNAGITVRTGSTFTVENIDGATTAFNDDLTVIGSALFTLDLSSDAFDITTAAGSLESIYSIVFGMTPTVFAAYPKTITGDPGIVGAVNDSKVFEIVSNHLQYVIDEQPGVYDGGLARNTYRGLAIDPAFISWIVFQDIKEPFTVSVGNLTKEDRPPVGKRPQGAPSAADIVSLQAYFDGTASELVTERARQLLWGVPRQYIENERFYSVVANPDSENYQEETPSPENTWNNLVI